MITTFTIIVTNRHGLDTNFFVIPLSQDHKEKKLVMPQYKKAYTHNTHKIF